MIVRPTRRDVLRYGVGCRVGRAAGAGHRPGLAEQADQDHLSPIRRAG